MRFIDLTGKKFGRWSVVGDGGYRGKNRVWLCVCECGVESVIDGRSLRSGNSKSCGCGVADALAARNTSHGMTGTPIYKVWGGMLNRCRNPKNRSYADYGGRGITVCERWLSFENFYADMGASFAPGLQIDRIVNDQGYSPGNCKWSSRSDQCRNRRSTVLVDTPLGRMTLVEASKVSGLKYQTIKSRVDRGCPVDEIFSKKRFR